MDNKEFWQLVASEWIKDIIKMHLPDIPQITEDPNDNLLDFLIGMDSSDIF